jgi:uncharacterized protein YecT (DUF1311 family)
MRRTKILLLLIAIFIVNPVYSKSIYSGDFDYRNYQPSATYFSGKSSGSIAIFCKKLPHASQEDMDQCGHRDFEIANGELNDEFKEFINKSGVNDRDLKINNEPTSTPYFRKSQDAWIMYRDNYCYGEAYELGQASMRYTVFWSCMTRMTKNRLSELKNRKDW